MKKKNCFLSYLLFQALIKANDEFAAEVERLYNVEEEQAEEIEGLQNQIKELQKMFSVLNEKHLEEENNLKTEISHLTESLNNANGKSTQILDKVKSVEEQYSTSLEVSYIYSIVKILRSNFLFFSMSSPPTKMTRLNWQPK